MEIMGDQNGFFNVLQKKERHTGLKQHEGE